MLEQLFAIRVHLDDCDDWNGALRVVPGSHRFGRLSQREALRERNQRGEHSVPVPRGGAMVMRPLLLHASSKATIDALRRVLHFVFRPATRQRDYSGPAENDDCLLSTNSRIIFRGIYLYPRTVC